MVPVCAWCQALSALSANGRLLLVSQLGWRSAATGRHSGSTPAIRRTVCGHGPVGRLTKCAKDRYRLNRLSVDPGHLQSHAAAES